MQLSTSALVRGARASLLVSAFVVPILANSGQAIAQTIPWRAQFEQAQAEARARQCPLWVQFTAPWCMYCRRMELEVFTQPNVISLASSAFVPVRVFSEQRPDLVARFGVAGLPATIILGPNGEYLNRRDGYIDAGSFLGILAAARPVAPRPQPVAAPAPQPQPVVAATSQPAKTDDGVVALAGNDVVNFVSGHGLKPGKNDFTAVYDGLVYRFKELTTRSAFLKSPEKYLPSNQGKCPVTLVDEGRTVPGDPHWGVYYHDRLYLCADEAARKKFAADPEHYANCDVAHAGYCPHCEAEKGEKVRGLPQFSLTRNGLRFLFPDASHLEAYRASLDQTRK